MNRMNEWMNEQAVKRTLNLPKWERRPKLDNK